MPGRPFVKGHTRGGRPKGSKSHTWLNVEYWYRRLDLEYIHLTPVQRAKISLEVMKVLINKLPSLPKDVGDSLQNAGATMELIKALESEGKGLPVERSAASQPPLEQSKSITEPLNVEQTIETKLESQPPINPQQNVTNL